jgi:multidrug efflux system outer membrane protein
MTAALKLRRLGIACAVLLGGCTVGPDYQRPAADLPARWLARPAATASAPGAVAPAGSSRLARADAAIRAADGPATEPVVTDKAVLNTAWWSGFGDPRLDELIRIALEENKELRVAAYRIEQFDAYLQIVKAAGMPQASYNASRTNDTLSENRQVRLSPGTEPVDRAYVASANVSWELDLWGKIRRADESALATLQASEESRRALALSLVAEVASGYVKLLSLDRELELLQRTVAGLRETLALAESRFRNGGSSELPVTRALADLLQAQSEVPAKEMQIAELENALSVLIGRNPGPIARGKTAAELVLLPVPGGLPAELLAQRPDIRKTEQDLVAANAKIGVAKAQYLPSISLTSTSGFASDDLSKLTMLTSNFGSFGVQMLGPLFTSGRVSGLVREAEAIQKQAATTYLKALQTALREVEDALVSHRKITQQVALRGQQVNALTDNLALARKRFDGGYSNYFDVLDADRSLTSGLQQQSQARRDQFTSLVAVYKALGGGWALPDVTAPRQPTFLQDLKNLLPESEHE